MTWIRKHAAICAAGIAFLAAIAAPYLTSIDPDSRVYRSGILTAILFLATIPVVNHILVKQRKKALLYGLFYALIFSFFLSIGSELTFYGAFLSGTGSMIRRLMIPLMMTPFLGTLFSQLLTWEVPEKKGQRLSWPLCSLLIGGVYILYYLAYYPGIVNYDFFSELAQYVNGPYFGAHPVFHTLMTGFLFTLGERLSGSYALGATLYCAVQIIGMAVIYGYVCSFVSKRVPTLASLLVLVFFALHPIHGFMSVSTIKDALFTACLVLLVIELWEMQEDPAAFLSHPAKMVRMAVTCLFMALFRHNAVFAYAFAVIAVIAICRRRKAILYCAAVLVLCIATPRMISACVSAWKTPRSEAMSVPCQQLIRTAVYADMPEEEREALGTWWSGAIDRYRPYSADPAKGGNFDYQRYEADPGAFWRMYLDYGRRYPKIYLEAFLLNCAGIWNPDDLSHAHAMDTEGWDFVYTKTEILFPAEIGTLTQTPILKRTHQFLQGIAHASRHEKYPFVSLLFRPSVYVYALLLLTFRLRMAKKGKQRLVLLPIWGIILSYVFSACILIRYAYAFMACVPVALVLAICGDHTKQQ